MIIKVRAKPRSKKEYVKEVEKDLYEVAVAEVPEKGKANERIIELLSLHLKIPKHRIHLLKGHSGKLKLFKID
ncbi:MAG: DUF167 domain-containing protein [Aquificaceae bacterium]